MCGIVGVCRASGPAQDLEPLLRRMCRSITHRGPDDEGYHIEGPVALGMRRLSVIDLETGRQPIRNEDGAISVVFNGEIYNFRELRQELIGRGHVFRTASDTEVIVHLYEELAEHCVTRLRGMFAIAVWDRVRQRLLLARDRLGVKPLFYRREAERLIFGSEIKSILQDPQVPREVDYEALDEMLRLGYTMPPRTSFAGISELPPGSILSYEGGALRVERYWSLDYTKREGYDERAALDELRERLTESIRLRMIADVPLGALLSGGLDSTVIVALMAGLSDRPVRTFSIGFGDAAFSELPLARKVAERYGTEHHEFVVEPDVIDLLPSLVRHHDTPFYDSSALPTWHVCRMARTEVTVALSGDGGDELFAGYDLYRADRAARLYGQLPRWLRNGLLRPLSRLLPETRGYRNLGRVAREFTMAGAAEQIDRYRRWTSKLKLETRQELYLHPELRRALHPASRDHIDRLFRERASDGALDRLLYVDIQTELAQDVLVKVDRMSMASSLEVRSPLLDHTLHEFAAGLPEPAKLHGRTTKVLLRRLARDLLPRELLERSKRGFMVPLDRWFRENLREYAREILLDPVTVSRGLFDPDAVELLLESHTSGRQAYGREIWNLLTVELWHRQYIDAFDRV